MSPSGQAYPQGPAMSMHQPTATAQPTSAGTPYFMRYDEAMQNTGPVSQQYEQWVCSSLFWYRDLRLNMHRVGKSPVSAVVRDASYR